jgi:hypothetical protein
MGVLTMALRLCLCLLQAGLRAGIKPAEAEPGRRSTAEPTLTLTLTLALTLTLTLALTLALAGGPQPSQP